MSIINNIEKLTRPQVNNLIKSKQLTKQDLCAATGYSMPMLNKVLSDPLKYSPNLFGLAVKYIRQSERKDLVDLLHGGHNKNKDLPVIIRNHSVKNNFLKYVLTAVNKSGNMLTFSNGEMMKPSEKKDFVVFINSYYQEKVRVGQYDGEHMNAKKLAPMLYIPDCHGEVQYFFYGVRFDAFLEIYHIRIRGNLSTSITIG
jgi:hypothetical protein